LKRWMRSKLWVAALIVSLIVSALSAAAMAAEEAHPSQPLTDRINKVYSTLSDEEKAVVSVARDNAKKLSGNSNVSDYIDPIYRKISSKAVDVSKEELISVIEALAIFYTPDGSSLTAVAPLVKPTLDKLTAAAELEALTWADVTKFVEDAEMAMKDKLKAEGYAALKATLQNADGFYGLLEEGYDALLADETYDGKVKQTIEAFGITALELKTLTQQVGSAVDPGKAASRVLLAGYIRSEAQLIASSTTNEYLSVRIAGIDAPVTIFDWTVDKENVKVETLSDKLRLSLISGGETEVILTGKLNLTGNPMYHQILYQGPVTVKTQQTSSPGPVFIPPTQTQPSVGLPEGADKAVGDAVKYLDELFSGKQAPSNNAGKRVAEKAAQQALQRAAVLDVSKWVKVEDGVASVELDINTLKSVFAKVKELAKTINSKLEEVGAKPVRVVATLNLGQVDSEQVRVPLTKGLLTAAKEQGIDEIAIQVNGVTLAVDVNEFGEDASLAITTVDESEAGKASANVKRVSGIYNIEFTAGDKAVGAFKKPVTISIQVEVDDEIDPELLTLTKIVDGRLEFYGGKYDEETGNLEGQRSQFSTYTVVENKVEFNDIAEVETWAGREIEVSAAKGIINGRGNGVYDPQANVTRAEFAALLVRAFGLQNDALTESFDDVNDTDWFQSYVAAAASNGIVNGRSAAEFDPNSNITRAEMATMAANALREVLAYEDAADVEAALSAFKDAADVQEWYKAGVALMAAEELIKGKGQGMYDPNGTATRAEAAVIVYRLFALI